MRLLQVIAVEFLCSLVALAASPATYSVARSDTANTPGVPDVPASVWGGATGAGSKWCNPDYNNICIWRLTDANTFPEGQAVQTDDAQSSNIVSADKKFAVVTSTSGTYRIVQFNLSSKTSVGVGPVYAFPIMFDENFAKVAYGLDGTQVVKLTTMNGWQTTTQTLIYDFATCLPTGFKRSWSGAWGTAVMVGNARTFGASFSDQGGQDTGEWVAVYSELNGKSLGCSTLNTQTGAVTGWHGQSLGLVDDGNGPLNARYTIHNAAMTRNPEFFGITPAGNNCLAGTCSLFYSWEIGTTHTYPCEGSHCDGHSANGYVDRVGSKQFWLRNLGDLADMTGPLDTNISQTAYDDHISWMNAGRTKASQDEAPFFISTTIETDSPILSFREWGTDEIMAVSVLTPSTQWRFGQTGNSGMSPFYTCINAKTTVLESGNGALFTSDMNGQGGTGALGFDRNGNPRCDVFYIEAK